MIEVQLGVALETAFPLLGYAGAAILGLLAAFVGVDVSSATRGATGCRRRAAVRVAPPSGSGGNRGYEQVRVAIDVQTKRRPHPQGGPRGRSRLPLFRVPQPSASSHTAILDVALADAATGAARRPPCAFSDLSGCAAATLATVVCYRTWRIEKPESRRRGWGLLTLATASWASARSSGRYYELDPQTRGAVPVVRRRHVPRRLPARRHRDARAPDIAATVLVQSRDDPRCARRRRRAAVRRVGHVPRTPVPRPSGIAPRAERSGSRTRSPTSSSRPSSIFVVVRAQPGRRTTLVLLALGLLSLAVADSAFAYLTADRRVRDRASRSTPRGTSATCCIALAAIRHDPSGATSRAKRRAPLRRALPVRGRARRRDPRRAYEAAGRHARSGPVLGDARDRHARRRPRQLITLVDNMSLTRNLEAKVRERTAALARSEERHRTLVQNSSDVVTILDRRRASSSYVEPVERARVRLPRRTTSSAGSSSISRTPRTAATVEAYLTRFMQRRPAIARSSSGGYATRTGRGDTARASGANLLDDPTVDGLRPQHSGHLRTQGARAPTAAPGLPRPAHGIGEPCALPRPCRPRAAARGAQPEADRRPVLRPRQPQGGQRPARS